MVAPNQALHRIVCLRPATGELFVERQLSSKLNGSNGSDAVSKRGEGSYSFLSCVYEWRTMIALFS